MKIGILGSGRMGATLGRLWAKAGHVPIFSYSRRTSKLETLSRETGGEHASVAETVAGADVLLLAVHWSQIKDVLELAGDLDGKIILNCCIPLNDSDTELVIGTTNSGAETLAKWRPEGRWVGCFNTCPSESLDVVFSRREQSDRPHLLAYGDDPGAKDIAKKLIRDIGFEPLEAGGLHTARFVEPFAMVTAELAYGQPGGAELTYQFSRLDRIGNHI